MGNTALGYGALYFNTATFNTAVGGGSLYQTKHEVGVIEEVGAVVPEVVTWEEDDKNAQSVDQAASPRC